MTAIRVLIAKPGLDGHDVGAKVMCRALRDAGMEVTYTGLRQSPQSIAAAAETSGVQVVGLSVLSGAHVPLCEQLRVELDQRGLLGNVLWLVGGNVPRRDIDALKALGVAGVFPTGADFDAVVSFIEEQVPS
jgi:methylmalonyl-CoA mutase, C-terminal domain